MQIRSVLRARRAARPVADPGLRPSTVTTAFWLYVATAVSSLVLNGLGLARSTASFSASEASARSSGVTAAEAHRDVVVTIVLIAAITVLYSALLVLFAHWMRQGRPRSRVVVTVLGAVSLLSVVGFTVAAVSAVLALFAIFFTYLPVTSDWFRTARRPAATV